MNEFGSFFLSLPLPTHLGSRAAAAIDWSTQQRQNTSHPRTQDDPVAMTSLSLSEESPPANCSNHLLHRILLLSLLSLNQSSHTHRRGGQTERLLASNKLDSTTPSSLSLYTNPIIEARNAAAAADSLSCSGCVVRLVCGHRRSQCFLYIF